MTTPPKPPSHLSRVFSLLRVGPKAIVYRFYDQFARKWTGVPVWAFSQITPNLYVGGQHKTKGMRGMSDEGITAIVNMREQHLCDSRNGIQGERYLHLATIDNTPPTLEDLEKGVEFITTEINKGGKVYVHCGVGVGRAPTQAAAYLISTGMTTEKALRTIQKKRPFIHLTGKQYTVLLEYEQKLITQKTEVKPSTQEPIAL
jgi:protein-tyrosine phosphatase